MSRVRRAAMVVVLLAAATAPGPFAQDDGRQACAERLKILGQACLEYAQENGGKLPASISVLLYQVYVSDLSAFVCPATKHELAGREDIDRLADYVLSPPSSGGDPKPVVQDRSAKNHGGQGINVFYSDGSVRWQPGVGVPAAEPAGAPAVGTPAPAVRQPIPEAPRPETPVTAVPTVRPVNPPPSAPAASPRSRIGIVPGAHDGQGVKVVDVGPGSPAARAGLRPGDLVLEVGERGFYAMRTPTAELAAAVGSLPPGAPVRLLVERDGTRFETTIVPEAVSIDPEKAALAKSALEEGRHLMVSGDYRGAAASFEQAIRHDPSQPAPYIALAESHFRRKDAGKEVEALRRGASAAPAFRIYSLLGSALLRAERYDEAIDWFTKAVAIMPQGVRDAGVFEQLGFGFMKKRRYQDALGPFERAYAINPRSPAAVYFLGGAHEALHHRDPAIRFYREYLALRADRPEWNKYAERRLDAFARGDRTAGGGGFAAFVDGLVGGILSSAGGSGADAIATGPGGRQPGGRDIAGTWSWFDNATLTMRDDGTFAHSKGYTGRWTLTDPASRRYTLTWSHGFTDTLTLSPDGRRLDGANQVGTKVWGVRRQ